MNELLVNCSNARDLATHRGARTRWSSLNDPELYQIQLLDDVERCISVRIIFSLRFSIVLNYRNIRIHLSHFISEYVVFRMI